MTKPVNNPLAILADIIIKVMQHQLLSRAEELIYLIHIKKLPEEQALKIVAKEFGEPPYA
ncbi:MAG TPA: hypothetical protein VK498_13185 [Ferruginibacter sp.]|nr:hypothetical protein [Ferruginibacter sp.]